MTVAPSASPACAPSTRSASVAMACMSCASVSASMSRVASTVSWTCSICPTRSSTRP